MDKLSRDLRYAVRGLFRSPGFALVAVLSLALGIGANTTIFTLISAVFMNPLPVRDISTLVDVYTIDEKNFQAGGFYAPISDPNYLDFRDQNEVFSGLANFLGPFPVTLSGHEEPRQINAMLASGNYFELLGLQPAAGRLFGPEADEPRGGHPVVVLSHALWQNELGADPGLIGKKVILNANPFTVIGVGPPRFKGTFSLGNPELVWIPKGMRDQLLPEPFRGFFDERRALFTSVFGRLRPGVDLETAEAAMKVIAARLERQYPETNERRSVALVPMAESAVGINQRDQLLAAGGLLMAVAGLVLLIACVNLANLLLARATTRGGEIGIRAALGAGRRRLLRQLLTESVLLGLAGGVAGLLVAFWGRDLLWQFRPPFLAEEAVDLSLDPNVLSFTLVVSLLTGILFGIVPAIRSSDPDLSETLKTGGRQGLGLGRSRIRSVLVVTQVALALVALIGAGLFVRSMQAAQRLNPGFDAEKLSVLSFNLAARQYTRERALQFFDQAMERASGVAGVEAAAISSNPPLQGGFLRSVLPEGRPADDQNRILVQANVVSENYFKTIGVPLLRGRHFESFDRRGTLRVAIINEAARRRFWPDENPVGKRFRFFGAEEEWNQVVGVVADSAATRLGEDPPRMQIFTSLHQEFTPFGTLYIRSATDPSRTLGTVRDLIQSLDPDLALTDVRTLREAIDAGLWAPRMGAALLGLFGLLALLLSVVGIYGVMSFNVGRQRRETGVRMALGAQRGDILRLIMIRGLTLMALGLAVGLAGAFALSRFAASLLFGISATDPLTFTLGPLVIAAVGLVACYIPARRATRVDPLTALRYE